MKKCCCSNPVIKSESDRSALRHIIILLITLAGWFLLYSVLGQLANWLTYCLCRLQPLSALSSAVEFFFYETPKVLMLLILVVFAVGILRSFLTPERTRRIVAGKSELVGNLLAALLGVVTPFCSCSAVPLFIGFLTSGIPLGVTFSFLISAPMINEIALVLLFSMFGWKIAALYLITGLLIAITAGFVLGRLKLEDYVEPWVYATETGSGIAPAAVSSWQERLRYAQDAVLDIVGKIWPYIVIGIAAGAGIHGYVPTNYLASVMGKDIWWSVPLSVLIGIPMYSNAAGIIPIVQALLGKGAALGTALAFMLSVIGLSLPEAIILRKVLKPRLIAVFMGVVGCGIIIVGYIFNLLL